MPCQHQLYFVSFIVYGWLLTGLSIAIECDLASSLEYLSFTNTKGRFYFIQYVVLGGVS